MRHDEIEAEGLVALYRRGELAPELEAAFEEHYFACAACQAELELDRGLEQGLKAVVAREVTGVQLGLLAWLGRRSRWAQWAIAGLALAAAALVPLAWWLPARERAARHADELAARLSESERQAADRLAATEVARTAERQALEAQIAELSAAASSPVLAPLANAPTLLLSTLRSGGEAVPVLHPDPASRWLTLAFDTDVDNAFATYRASLRDARGRQLWHGEGLRPTPLEAVLVSFPRELLPGGAYTLAVAGEEAGGGVRELATYRFEVRP